MAVFAVVDETGFERGLDARHDRLVDIALALFAPFDLVFEIEQFLSVYDRQPTFFGLGRIDEHAFHVHSFFTPRSHEPARGCSPHCAPVRPLSTGPVERGNDARETKTEPMEGTALDCWPGLLSEAVDTGSVGAFGVSRCGRGARRWMFPEDHLRSRPRPLLQIHAADGPGHGARAGRRRRRSAGTRWAPAGAVRTRPRSGAGSDEGGKRTPCVCECKESDTSHQRRFPSGITSGDLGKPLSPACVECRSVHWSLLFRVFASGRRATSWSPACRGAERVASPDLPRVFRYLAPRRRALVVEF